ncbi:hypothetical protein F441_06885 [Phytophthora nicotianae CJ01A1]|uniref:C-type lectin domain-containing protein n=4 Tax=Phytophthora nicotianae TaxID=4792 RepID=W2RFR4_PHYN3|nr:hypothetical protein PPTG_02952 [Phytophthora nicotianae INRA-310]ETK89088.1 hypothetical protein L915_06758 [Phytophthora nicotianae]ETO77927.1 hypothetical protein F444_06952 [Phytophthora nicotianae P1976]ETP18969.1 hypothetical protein F441_06885 [Phytophthora nicotianae CJ01A1]ETL42499.1 hypothetical protein L916_06696 [Phytophthora nicotianae]ETL95670.1 hypothetical protein L917_06564 [Phytophthora nicotianae]
MKFLAFFYAVLSYLLPPAIEAHSWLVKPVSRETGPRTTDGTIGCPTLPPVPQLRFPPARRSMFATGAITISVDSSDGPFHQSAVRLPQTLMTKFSSTHAENLDRIVSLLTGQRVDMLGIAAEITPFLAWVWFGVGSSYGNIGWAEPQFVSCADITLTSAGSGSETGCPTFVGGDRVTKNENLDDDECFYFYTNSIESTQYKGSNDDYEQYYIFGKPSYVDSCSGPTADSGNSTMAPTTQNPVTTAPASTTESPLNAPTATSASSEHPEATSNESSVAGDSSNISDESIDNESPDGTVAPGGCKSKNHSWTRG